MEEDTDTFRNYTDSLYQERVEQTYKNMLENQTVVYVYELRHKYSKFPNKEYGVWEIIEKVNSIVDESDPDNNLPQIFHFYQTGESIKSYIDDSGLLLEIQIRNFFSNDEWNNLPERYQTEFNTTLKDYYSEINDWSWLPVIGFIHDLGKNKWTCFGK